MQRLKVRLKIESVPSGLSPKRELARLVGGEGEAEARLGQPAREVPRAEDLEERRARSARRRPRGRHPR